MPKPRLHLTKAKVKAREAKKTRAALAIVESECRSNSIEWRKSHPPLCKSHELSRFCCTFRLSCDRSTIALSRASNKNAREPLEQSLRLSRVEHDKA